MYRSGALLYARLMHGKCFQTGLATYGRDTRTLTCMLFFAVFRFFYREYRVSRQRIRSAFGWSAHGELKSFDLVCDWDLHGSVGSMINLPSKIFLDAARMRAVEHILTYHGLHLQYHSTDILLGAAYGQSASGRVVRGLVHRIVLVCNPWLRFVGFFP